MRGIVGTGAETANPVLSTASKLKLQELITMRGVLRKLQRSSEGCDTILGNDIERDKWTTFLFEQQTLTIPTDVMMDIIKELKESLDSEIKALLARFAEYNIDPTDDE